MPSLKNKLNNHRKNTRQKGIFTKDNGVAINHLVMVKSYSQMESFFKGEYKMEFSMVKAYI